VSGQDNSASVQKSRQGNGKNRAELQQQQDMQEATRQGRAEKSRATTESYDSAELDRRRSSDNDRALKVLGFTIKQNLVRFNETLGRRRRRRWP